jgi:hypothetical protein
LQTIHGISHSSNSEDEGGGEADAANGDQIIENNNQKAD